jgi:chromosome segregation ATPase
VAVERLAFKDPSIAHLAGQLAEHERRQAHPSEECSRLTVENAELQRENARLMKSKERLQADNSEMKSERKAHFALKAELKMATADHDKLEKKLADWYEPELVRLKSHVEHSKFEKETQMLRRRVMAYAEQSRRIAGSVATLEGKIAELEHLRESWYVPELGRLSDIIQQHEKTKREWFEPQLESRAAHIAALQEQLRTKDELIKTLEEKNAACAEASAAAGQRLSGRIFRFKR